MKQSFKNEQTIFICLTAISGINFSKIIKLFSFVFPILMLAACGKGGSSLPTVSGTKYEVLVVMGETQWKAPAGRAIVALLDQDMQGLPQPEAIMKITRCSPSEFTDIMKPARNILLTEISEKYTRPRVIYTTNKWAKPQSVVRVVAPNDSAFESTMKTYGENILNYFLKTERDRQIEFNKSFINTQAQDEIMQQFGIRIDIINGITRSTKKKDFYWITNDNPVTRQDIVIYSYPYTDKNTFTREYLLAKRDSVMRANIPGESEGSYMGTEYNFEPPVMKTVSVNGGYSAEIRGLWKMKGGGIMGGPFVNHTRLDEINQRVITIEGFVFAPGQKKRNALRQLEAIIYSARLPQEINALKELSVEAKSKK